MTSGSFTVSGFENTIGDPSVAVPSYWAYEIGSQIFLLADGMTGIGAGSVLSIEAGSIPASIRPTTQKRFKVWMIIGDLGNWGEFVINPDGSATYYATETEDPFPDATEINVGYIDVQWTL